VVCEGFEEAAIGFMHELAMRVRVMRSE
jgi:hypothetical protein